MRNDARRADADADASIIAPVFKLRSFGMLKSTVVAAGLMSLLLAAPALANSTVNVTLWDKGSTAPMVMDKGIGMTADLAPATMGVKLSTDTVPAGEITFNVTNSSQETVHEMVVFPYKDGEQVPFSSQDAKINEDLAGHLGEVSELDPAKGGALKISLKPGKYILTCNIPGHYMNGMWAILTVK
jgi:uncharacterized cupredoxin-like copper-binding protein